MVFSTPIFLTIFFPLVLLGAWGLGWMARRFCAWRGMEFAWGPVNLLLLAASLGFYFWGEGWGVAWLVASVCFNAACARVVAACEKEWARRWGLGVAIAGNLAFLGWFKYAAFAARSLNVLPGVTLPIPQVALPLGISFYTFQAMSYVWDVFRREVPPARRLTDFACYLTFFPQLVAGPIVRYADIAAGLQSRNVELERVASGFKRFLCGLAKKTLLANVVAEAVDAIWAVVEQGSGVPLPIAWAGAIGYALQIYYDFSGYSDMAIGMGRMFGFDFKENFLHPYSALGIRDFWRKWHISLSSWFRDYLYIPLGGNRHGTARTIVNGMIVFGLCGLWHGASAMFILWGLWHGLFLTMERLCLRNKPGTAKSGFLRQWPLHLLGHAYTWAVVLAGWVLFRSESLSSAARMFQSLAGMGDVAREARALWLCLSPKVLWALGIGLLLSLPVAPALRKLIRRTFANPVWSECLEWLVLTFLGLAALLFLAGGAYNPFIYFRF